MKNGAKILNISKSAIFNLNFDFQCEKWSENPEQFVEDEDEDSFTYSVRISSQDLLTVSLSSYVLLLLQDHYVWVSQIR